MTRRRRAGLAVAGVALLGLLGGCAIHWMDGPWGMIPGGAFRGPQEPCADAPWMRLANETEVELETRPTRPRSVTTWSVVHDGALYVPADFLTPFKRWPHDVVREPHVRVRVRDRIFACVAHRVEEPRQIERLRELGATKYDVEPGGLAATSEVWWFRLASE